MSRVKYKYIEEFKDPATGLPVKGGESPKYVNTKHFGRKLLHQIAKCKYIDTEENGEKKVYLEMGDIGGWIENKGNLSQEGDCWIEETAIACGNSSVRGDAILKDKTEIGDNAVVSGSSILKDRAWIKDRGSASYKALIMDDSHIEGNGMVKCMVAGKSTIKDNARVFCDRNGDDEEEANETPSIKDSVISEMAYLSGDVRVFGAKINGNAKVVSYARIGEGVVVKGNSFIAGDIAGEIEIDSCILCTRLESNNKYDEPIDMDKVKSLGYNIENIGEMDGAIASFFDGYEFTKEGNMKGIGVDRDPGGWLDDNR